MKKFFLSLVLMVPAIVFADYTCTPADCFSGWDVTVGVGYSAVLDTLTLSDSAVPLDHTIDSGKGSVAVQGKMGWNCGICNDWVFGASFYAQYNAASRDINISNATFSANIKRKLPVNLGLEFRGGYAYCTNQLLYLGIGPDWGYTKEDFSSTRYGSESRSDWLVAPRLLGGAEQRVCGKLILKEEFSYSWYNKKRHTHTSGANTLTATRNINLATFMFSAGYLF